ncbi:MAG: phosphodiester glycosidase family protein [Clostridiaceae bacterium]|nr:phosphodiester glycosidase family protein [Clostridiaceae bacterium]
MINRWTKLAGLMILTLVVLWLSCPFEGLEDEPEDGHLLSPSPTAASSSPVPTDDPTDSPMPGETPGDQEPPFSYEKQVIETADGPIVMHFLEIDMKSNRVGVKPVTSHRTLFGYEYLSVMARNSNALAAVNGGFSHPNGLPGGMLYSNKILKTPATGNFPVLFLLEDRAVIADASQKIWLQSGKAISDPVFFNLYSEYDGIYVFTPIYGSSDRLEKPHLCAVVRNGKVSDLVSASGPVSIPYDGFLVSAVGTDAERRLRDFIAVGQEIEIKTELKTSPPLDGEYVSAYECGSWIIRDGVNVCPDSDGWVGTLLTRAPRTAVGIKSDGALLFIVVDGRNKDISIGVSGPELADLMLERGVTQAAMLDGGASSEMIIGDTIVNSLSAGRERLISSCFVVFSKE